MKYFFVASLLFSFCLKTFSESHCERPLRAELIPLLIDATAKIQACIDDESVKDCLKDERLGFKVMLFVDSDTDGITACHFVPKDKMSECTNILNVLFKFNDIEKRKKIIGNNNRVDYFRDYIFRKIFYVPSEKKLKDDARVEPCFSTAELNSLDYFQQKFILNMLQAEYQYLPAVRFKKIKLKEESFKVNSKNGKKTEFVIDTLYYQVPIFD